jgi:hypothetical protein
MLSRLLSDIDRLCILDSLCPNMRKYPRFGRGDLAQERRHAREEPVAAERLTQCETHVCRNVSIHD